tara:strand:+ start:257 stop:517 length:261 start_codon:yes stop_codon:yes gene_type:complete
MSIDVKNYFNSPIKKPPLDCSNGGSSFLLFYGCAYIMSRQKDETELENPKPSSYPSKPAPYPLQFRLVGDADGHFECAHLAKVLLE